MKRLYTATITPFKEGEIDLPGFRRNLADQPEGVVVLGTTGEAPTLTGVEQEALIRAAVEEKDDVFVGTGTSSTATTVANTQRAQELGAQGALVIAPYYVRPTQEGLYQHFRSVAESTDLPILLYNHPGRTGINIAPSTLWKLAEISNIIGVKEATGNFDQILEVLASRPEGFLVYSGNDSCTLPMMALGAEGVISVVGNLVPDLMAALVADPTQERHDALYPLFRASTVEMNPIPIKAMMQLAGLPAGDCRAPLTPPSCLEVVGPIVERYFGVAHG